METLKHLVKKFDLVDDNITEKNFPPETIRKGELKLFHFPGEYLTREKIIERMKKEGYAPVNIYELLSWKEWDGSDSVAALGSSCSVSGLRHVTFLSRYGSIRSLHLSWWDYGWNDYYRFLGVRVNKAKLVEENGFNDDNFINRFWSQVEKTDECWHWIGSKHEQGYGLIKKNNTSIRAHRVSVIMSGREIPKGYEVDHLCKNTSCVRPEHLEVTTAKENTLRNSGPTAINAKKTHCIRGHEFTKENTRIQVYEVNKERRICKSCEAVRTLELSNSEPGPLDTLALPEELTINGIKYKRN